MPVPNALNQPIQLRERLAYGAGDFAFTLYFQTFIVYLTYYYTDVFGLSAAAVATMLGLSRSLDAVTDPIVGMVADRTKSRWGRFRPYILWFGIPFVICGVLTFTVPDFTSSGKLIWAWATYNALMLFYTLLNIPYTALLGVLTPDHNTRTALSSLKFIFAFAAGMLVSATILPLTKFLGSGNEAQGWQRSFIIIGAVSAVLLFVSFYFTNERVKPPRSQKSSVRRDLVDLIANRPWVILITATVFFIIFTAVRSSVSVYYFKYYIGAQTLTLPSFLPRIGGTHEWSMEVLVSAFNTIAQMCALLGVILIPFVSRAIGGKKAFMILLSIAIACVGWTYFARPDQVVLVIALQAVGALVAGPLSALIWAMFADVADYSEWRHGRRATGLVFSASLFVQKQGWAIGAAVALGLMASVNFEANIEQTEMSLHGLRMLMSFLPAAFGVVSVLLFAFYPLNERRMAEIEADLRQRRETNAM